MLDTIFFFLHYALLLLFGVLLSVAFAGVRLSERKNIFISIGIFVVCGLLQLGSLFMFGEDIVWKIYPFIIHLPIILVLCTRYHKRFFVALSAITSAYFCCQPAKWVGLLCDSLFKNYSLEMLSRILTLLLVGYIAIRHLAPYLSILFNKDIKSVCIFGSVPVVYYIFDYSMGIYTDFWIINDRTTAEFLPMFLCIVFMLFCIIYLKEYEQKSDAEQKENLIRVTLEQQAKEFDAIIRSEKELRILRHDMRLFLSSLAVCIEEGNLDKAQEMISSYSTLIDGTKVARYCLNDTINYVFSDFAAKCAANDVNFSCNVAIEKVHVDDLLFASILSNILDNALNAQLPLPTERRNISVMLKTSDNRLLLSVKNPVDKVPTFSDGVPLSTKEGHGYGTQSIRYMAERLGGNCQFTVQNDVFVTRVII